MRNHKVDGQNYEPDGWWAVIQSGVPVPCENPDVVSDFRATWKVDRLTEPGLTVVVPYVGEDLDAEQLRRSVIRDYFVAILFKTLSVEIASTDNTNNCEISYSTLDDVIETLPDPTERGEVRRNADLTRSALALPPAEVIYLAEPNGQPSWQQANLVPDAQRQLIQEVLEKGDIAVIRVPVEIALRDEAKGVKSSFDVVLQSEVSHRGAPLFVRKGIIVSEVRSRSMPGIRAIVLIRQGAMADLLGDAEGPAHTNWSEKTDRFKGKYKYGQAWLTFVRQAPARILDIVRAADDAADRTLGAPFFPMPADAGGQDIAGGAGKGKTSGGPPKKVNGTPPKIRVIRRTAGGFTVRLTDAGADLTSVEVTAAYDRSRGNPFSKWSKQDFDVSEFEIAVDGGNVITQEHNRVVAGVTDPESFALRIGGFDVNRDLRVRTRGRTGA